MTGEGLRQALDALHVTDDVAALLGLLSDADMFITLRDGDARLAWSSDWGSRVLGSEPGLGLGRRSRPGVSFYYLDGRPMPLSERPSERARRHGRDIVRSTFGLAAPGLARRWVRAAAIPLRQEREGWVVLTVGVDVTSIIEGTVEE